MVNRHDISVSVGVWDHFVGKSDITGETGLDALGNLEYLGHKVMYRNRPSMNRQSSPSGLSVAPGMKGSSSAELAIASGTHPEYVAHRRSRDVYIPINRDLEGIMLSYWRWRGPNTHEWLIRGGRGRRRDYREMKHF